MCILYKRFIVKLTQSDSLCCTNAVLLYKYLLNKHNEKLEVNICFCYFNIKSLWNKQTTAVTIRFVTLITKRFC